MLKWIYSFRRFVCDLKAEPKRRNNALRKLKLNLTKAKGIGTYLPFSKKELISFSSFLYTENGKPLHQHNENDLLMFSTQEVTQIDEIYSRKALDNLIAQKGLHSRHCYILIIPIHKWYFQKALNMTDKLLVQFIEHLSKRLRAK
jgi:hypothetical protein